MDNEFGSSSRLNIDLSFISYKFEDINICLDSKSIDLIESSNFWNKEITSWIKYVQSNEQFKCPKEVRSASKISLGLELTSDSKIAELNHSWLGKSKSTDVLSFPIIDETFIPYSSECIELGDIVISVPTAIRQAQENNVDLLKELRWLATHGLLHLLGWDHCDEESLSQMLITQEHLLALSVIL
tara:strand:- start:47 stop:601 length:555 start_codon:yes stop_codon:yes gene_type:complete